MGQIIFLFHKVMDHLLSLLIIHKMIAQIQVLEILLKIIAQIQVSKIRATNLPFQQYHKDQQIDP